MKVHIIIGKLCIVVVDGRAVVRSAVSSGRAVCRHEGLALQNVCLNASICREYNKRKSYDQQRKDQNKGYKSQLLFHIHYLLFKM